MIAPAHYAIGAASALLIQNYLPAGSGDKTRIAWALGIAIASHVVADIVCSIYVRLTPLKSRVFY